MSILGGSAHTAHPSGDVAQACSPSVLMTGNRSERRPFRSTSAGCRWSPQRQHARSRHWSWRTTDRLSVFIRWPVCWRHARPLVPGTQLTLITVSATGADRWTSPWKPPKPPEPSGRHAARPSLHAPSWRDTTRAPSCGWPLDMGYLPRACIKITQANGDFADPGACATAARLRACSKACLRAPPLGKASLPGRAPRNS